MANTKIKMQKISNHIELFQYGSYKWLNVTKATQKQTDYLAENFDIIQDDLNDTLPPLQRPKIVARENYTFMILSFPLLNGNGNSIKASEFNIFIFPKLVITIHNNELEPLRDFRKEIAGTTEAKKLKNVLKPPRLTQHILSHLYDYCLPISAEISNNIDQFEDQIFKADLANKQIIEKIFTIEQQVVDYRKIMRSHKNIIDQLVALLPTLTKEKLPHGNSQELSQYPRSIWTYLEADMEAIDALRNAYESLTSFHLNDILKILAIISIIIAPMTLIASIFGMNFRIFPFVNDPNGFLLSILLMLFLSLLAALFFKWKKWF